MSQFDRDKWNQRYTERAPAAPSVLVESIADWLPPGGRALDVAGGAGRHGIWLARRGLDVTIADISAVGLQLAAERARDAGVAVETLEIDLDVDPLPAGPWDVILSFHFLLRPLFDQFPARLAPQGVLVVLQPTVTNLSRHEKPPRGFLLEDGELPGLIEPLQVLHYAEGWLAEGRHDALVVATRKH